MSGEGGTLIIMGTRGGIWEHSALVGIKSQAGFYTTDLCEN